MEHMLDVLTKELHFIGNVFHVSCKFNSTLLGKEKHVRELTINFKMKNFTLIYSSKADVAFF
jgi:hypothetical protein